MSYLFFDKTLLTNLSFSLAREYLMTNKTGCFTSSTAIGCNTRKYHGLLVCPLEDFDAQNHVLLSNLDEEIFFDEQLFQLGIHRYPGVFSPTGHKYLASFEYNPVPVFIYRIGSLIIKKELLLADDDERIMIRYTVMEAARQFTLRLKPFLAYRNAHALSKANYHAVTKFAEIENGIKYRMYASMPYLHMQLSKESTYVPIPSWYDQVEYPEEQRRGYEFHEDLFVPGYFELTMKKGDTLTFSAGLSAVSSSALLKRFNQELKKRPALENVEACLKKSASDFITTRNKKTEICAGYPWFSRGGRDTLIALPGLTLSTGDPTTCFKTLESISKEIQGCLVPDMGSKAHPTFNSVDAPMWYFWAIQQYVNQTQDYASAWKSFGSKMKQILSGLKEGICGHIRMNDNGLIFAGAPGMALTWMNAIVHGQPVTPRTGYNVEINALWYNAVCFTLALAEKNNDTRFVKQWQSMPALIARSFNDVFTSEDHDYLADFVHDDFKDWSVRPNQVIATSVDYSPIDTEMKKKILQVVSTELLTTKGLRTLSPYHPQYRGRCAGPQAERDLACHQGSVWPWLLGHFAQGYLKIHKKKGVPFITGLLVPIEQELCDHGVGTISQMYDGDPPHKPRGSVSQAWSVAEILRVKQLISNVN